MPGSSAKRPSAQSRHAKLPARTLRRPGDCRMERPVVMVYLPGSQGTHSVRPSSLANLPAGQGSHSVRPSTGCAVRCSRVSPAVVPFHTIPQRVQFTAPVSLLKVPNEQSLHSTDPSRTAKRPGVHNCDVVNTSEQLAARTAHSVTPMVSLLAICTARPARQVLQSVCPVKS